jgi:vacuolar-type H+-ATPase subunit H
MRPVNEWLERFRRPAAVPAAAADDLSSELMPIFAALTAIEDEARQVHEDAEREASRRVEGAAAEADEIIAESRRRAEAERARSEAARRESIAAEAQAIELEAEAEARRIREVGRTRIPPLVAAVIARIAEGSP